MKTILMRLLRRLTVATLGAGLAAYGGWTVLGLAGALPTDPLTLEPLAIHLNPWLATDTLLLSLTAGAQLAAGLGLLALGLLPDGTRAPAYETLAAGSQGQIRLSSRSLRQVAGHAVERIDGVRQATCSVNLSPDGWRVQGQVALWADAPAHSVGASIERELEQSLRTLTGLPVDSVHLDLAWSNDRTVH